MFNFVNKKNKEDIKNPIQKIAALLVHAAKIDENYTEKEKKIIKQTINELDQNIENIDEILENAEKTESESNQILDFTKEVKNLNEATKVKIIEVLWSIIYSDNNSDIYENNLMRRLAGLLYIDSKLFGKIKEEAKKKFKK